MKLTAICMPVVIISLLSLAVGDAASQAPASPQQQLAQVLRDLGQCEAAIGPLRQVHAGLVDGSLLDLAAVKARLEKVNPSYVFDAKTFTISPKPEPKP